MKFQWMHEHRACFDVALMCHVLGVSRAGYYASIERPPSGRERRRRDLAGRIRAAHASSRGTYGSPRVTAELNDAGVSVCENTVAKYMRQDGLKVKRRRRFVPHTTDGNHPHAVAPNTLDRRFAAGADAPDRRWCCDLTYVRTGEGWLYLWVVIDLFSRRVVGWSMSEHTRAEAAAEALTMAISRRRPGVGLLHHSDRGVQYACEAYRGLLAAHGIACSMSRRGNCHDNAVAESFFATFKDELVEREPLATRAEARTKIFQWIECWYNRRRRHSSLGYLSPEAFEARLN